MRLNLHALLRAFPSSLFARMALILLVGLLAAQLASLWLQWGERATVVAQARGLHLADRIAEAVRVLEAGDPSRRSSTISALQSDDMRVSVIDADQVSPNSPRGPIQAAIGARLGSEREIRSLGSGGGGGGRGGGGGGMQRGNPLRSFDLRLNDGQWVRITAAREAEAPALPGDLIAQLLITLIIVTAVVMIAVRQATRPLQQMADAADTLGRDLDAPPLAETGPAESRRAAQAFNRMQARIKRLIDERARALAAVSHDLRTPLTRLRLRAELVDDEKLRDQMAADLDAMASMIDATLDYLRGLQDSEVARPIDMNALLQSLAEDAEVIGRAISVEGTALTPYRGRLSALRRALQNLIDNAIKYGHSARIRIDDDPAVLRIVVEDEGPGIAPAELVRVTEPYYRPDASRSRETGGVGLGLSIVKDIALMHGGELLLANRPQGGLSATLVLPRSQRL
ncbi:ATP-binding protein [Propionivibrio sp.]|uniref:ATP-binding protein n=1 Tax=Propionivibrio sp. TaxID=2212460 RepID=UPI003BF1AD18